MQRKQFFLFAVLIFGFLLFGLNSQDVKKNRELKFGIFANLSAQHNYYVYTEDLKWRREEPGTSFKESFYSLSFLSHNKGEFDLFYRKLEAKSVFIAGGLWDTKKIIAGASFGKILTVEIKIPKTSVSLPIDFSGGPYVTFAYKHEYNFISGNEASKVPMQKTPAVGYGIYTNIRFCIKFSQNKSYPSLMAGFKYFIPFDDFEYNSEEDIFSYRLERKFFYLGISF